MYEQTVRRWTHTLAAAAVALPVLLGAPGPAQATAPRVSLDWHYGTHWPDAPTSLRIRLGYRPGDGSGGKAPALEGLVLRAPASARFDPAGRPLCTAGDVALRLLGRDACPAGSRIGGGSLTADTGLGAPVDPFATEVAVFATPAGFVELVQYPGTNLTLGFDRVDVEGERLTAHPPATPGGPPDGRTTVRDIDLVFPAAGGYVRTPFTCPPGGWVASVTATFSGAGSVTATDDVTCRPLARRAKARRCKRARRATRARKCPGRRSERPRR